jgi:hypothetical protein
MAVGAVSYFGGDGTVASFTAQVSNVSNGITSGTLTMTDTLQSGTACLSQNATTNDNNYANCAAVITLPNVAPGVYGGVAQITVKNTGTLDARDLYLSAPSVNPTLNATLSSGQTTLTVTHLSAAVVKGQQIVVGPAPGGVAPTTTEIFYAAAAAAANATSVTVTAAATNGTPYPINTPVDIRDCYDTVSTGYNFNSTGTSPNFTPLGNNALCGSTIATTGGLVMYVQEVSQTSATSVTTNYNYCWYGNPIGGASPTGACYAPVSTTLTSTITSGNTVTSLPVASMDGNVKSGDKIVVAQSGCTQTFSSNAPQFMNVTTPPTAGSIGVTSVAATCTFTSGATVTDATATTDTSGPIATLDSDTHTISSFDASDEEPGGVSMPQLKANGTQEDGSAFSQLPAGASRTFDVGIFFTEPTGSIQNTLQGLASTFGLTWHVDE